MNNVTASQTHPETESIFYIIATGLICDLCSSYSRLTFIDTKVLHNAGGSLKANLGSDPSYLNLSDEDGGAGVIL